MWRTQCAALLLVVIWGVLQAPAGATVVRTGDTIAIGRGEVVDDDLVIAARNVTVEGTVRGDLMAAANTVRVPGRVDGNLQVLAQTVDVSGATTGSARVAGQSVRLSGTVGRNAEIAAQSATLEPRSRVGRDANVAAQTANVDGAVGGSAALAATTARVTGQVRRDLRFQGSNLALGPSARVGGDLVVRSNTQPDIASGAVVAGQVRRLPVERPERRAQTRGGFGLAGNLLAAFALFVAGAIGLALAPRFLRTAANLLDEQPGWSVLWGLVLLIVVPIAAVLAFLTVLGIPIGLVAAALWFFAILFSAVPVAIFLGRWITGWIRHGEPLGPYANLAIGLGVLALLFSIPIVGGLVRLAVILFGIGVFSLAAYRLARPQTGGPAPAGAAPAPA